MEDTIVNNNDLIPLPEKGLKKIVNKIFSLPLVPKLMIVITTFVVLSVGLYVALAKDPQVAFLGIFGGGPVATPVPATPPVPVTPPVYPSPSAYSRPCSPNSNVTDLRLSGSCGTNGFNYINVRCTNGEDHQVNIVAGTCYSVQEALNKGIEYCKSTVCVTPSPISSAQPLPSGCVRRSRVCTAETANCPTFIYCPPSPAPSWPPTPPPTSDPTPLVQCTPEVYKLPTNLSLEGLTSSSLLPYKVDPYRIEGKLGERYAINIVLKNIRGYDLNGGTLGVKAWTVNSLGAGMPISILSAGTDCSTGYSDKTVRCASTSLPIKNGLEVRPNMFHIFSIDSVTSSANGTINYNGIYAATPFSCPPTSISVSPQPTPTPTPKPVAKSKYQICRAACYARYPLSNKRRGPCIDRCERNYL